ncbi:hypothetical protein NO2_0081, partial [Candidatus Termititenax persephonae]
MVSLVAARDMTVKNNANFSSLYFDTLNHETTDGHRLVKTTVNQKIHTAYVHKVRLPTDEISYAYYRRYDIASGVFESEETVMVTGNRSDAEILETAIAASSNGEVYIVVSGYDGAYKGFLSLYKIGTDGNVSSLPIWSYSADEHFFSAEILVAPAGIYIAAGYDGNNGPGKLRLFHIDYNSPATGAEVNYPTSMGTSGFIKSGTRYMSRAQRLILGGDGYIYLSFDWLDQDDSSIKSASVYKYQPASGHTVTWGTNYITLKEGYIAHSVSLLPPTVNAGPFQLVFAKKSTNTPANTLMTLEYREYASWADAVAGVSVNVPTNISAPGIYSPQLGLTADKIQVIQYISQDTSLSGFPHPEQISRASPTSWHPATNEITETKKGVFLHLLPQIENDQPYMLWAGGGHNDPNYTEMGDFSVYFAHAPDKIPPWQPAAPSITWVDPGPNSSGNQTITV